MKHQTQRFLPMGLMLLGALLLVACSSAATATPPPTNTVSPPAAPTNTPVPGAANTPVPPTATPTVAPTATGLPPEVASARDQITLVVFAEPLVANPFLTVGGSTTPLIKDNLVDPLTWQSADDLRIVPSTATESWEQLSSDTWRFQLR
jgi:hypothetical protein